MATRRDSDVDDLIVIRPHAEEGVCNIILTTDPTSGIVARFRRAVAI
jgi:hypothetical protein